MKKAFMFASALVLVAMSVAVTSCKKDKDKEPDSCTCHSNGKTEVFTGSDLETADGTKMTCKELSAEFQEWGGYCE